MTQELVGAFVDDGNNADFIGTDGDVDPTEDGSPDTIEFMTDYRGSIYKIRYELQAGHVLHRLYSENPADYSAAPDNDIDFGFRVSNINFYYWGVGDANWSLEGGWSEDPPELPQAVRILLELQDMEGRTFSLETDVFLPNSE